MKKLLAFFLIAATLLSLAGCKIHNTANPDEQTNETNFSDTESPERDNSFSPDIDPASQTVCRTHDIKTFRPSMYGTDPKITELGEGKLILLYPRKTETCGLYYAERTDGDEYAVVRVNIPLPEIGETLSKGSMIEIMPPQGADALFIIRFENEDGIFFDCTYSGHSTQENSDEVDFDALCYDLEIIDTRPADKLNGVRSSFDPEYFATLIPNENADVLFWLKTRRYCYYFCSIRRLNEYGTAYTADLSTECAVFCYDYLDQNIYRLDTSLPSEDEYVSVTPVIAYPGEHQNGMTFILALDDNNEVSYLKYSTDDASDGSFSPVSDDELAELRKEYSDAFKAAPKTNRITDIAEWDRLNWSAPSNSIYRLISYLVEGNSEVHEFNGLGIEDYSITLIDDSHNIAIIEFTFTVTGNSLAETLPRGTYTKYIEDAYYLDWYDSPVEHNEDFYAASDKKLMGLDKYGGISAVKATDSYLTYGRIFQWQIPDFGEWNDESLGSAISYISVFYSEDYDGVEISELLRLLGEKFGMTDIEINSANDFYSYSSRCSYDEASGKVRFSDTRGSRRYHKFTDVYEEDGITNVTVQFFADDLYLIPSDKIVYRIGEELEFLGCEIIEKSPYPIGSIRY